MIVGLGQDMVDIRRIERTLARFGERFEQRCFTEVERAKAHSRSSEGKNNSLAATYAKRYAAKEACAKALGTGLARGVFWKEMEVINLSSGHPTMRLYKKAADRAHALTHSNEPALHVTLTDEYPYAQATVILSKH